MKCYLHRDKDAIGVCSRCFKAICPDCSRELNGKMVCVACLRSADAGESAGAGQSPFSGKLGAVRRLLKLIFPHRRTMPMMKEKGAEMITPVFLGGAIAGILAGIPVLNLLFVPIVALGAGLSVVFLRAEEDFEFAVSEEQGKKAGALAGLLAAFVSIFVAISLEMLLAGSAYEWAKASITFLVPAELDLVLKVVGLDKDLSLPVIQLKFAFSLIAFTIIGYFSGMIAARRMR